MCALLIPSLSMCMCACAPFFFAQTWKTLFVRHLDTQKGRLYKIPACWSNGTVGKATIVVVTMKRLSSMTLREKCTQFVFCPSLLLTLAVTFPSPCPYILPLCPPLSSQSRPSSTMLFSHPAPCLRSHPFLPLLPPPQQGSRYILYSVLGNKTYITSAHVFGRW